MKFIIYVVDIIIFFLIFFIGFFIIGSLVSFAYPDVWKWSAHTHPFLKVLATPSVMIIFLITYYIHHKILSYTEKHDMKEAAIGFFQILGIAFLALLQIIEMIVSFLFPIAIIYLAYHFLTH